MDVSERLKAERKRLGLTQQAMAEACGVSKRQQINYEAGQWPGGEYLAQASRIGVDVGYALTGNAASGGTHLTPEEALLIAAYRRAPAPMKALVLAALGEAAPPAGGQAGIVIHGGKQGSVVQGDVKTDSIAIGVGRRKVR